MNFPSSEKSVRKSSVYLNKTQTTRKFYPISTTVLFTGLYVLFKEYLYTLPSERQEKEIK